MKNSEKKSKAVVITSEVEKQSGFEAKPVVKKAKSIATIEGMKKKIISRTDALNLMRNNKGKFFSAVFVTKKATLRTINGQYQGTTELGYVIVAENGKRRKKEQALRNINLQTLEMLSIGGKTFNVG